MRFRITEPTFFWGKDRQVGEIMEAPTGPYRNFATGGGLQRIAQFVEMPEEIKQVLSDAAQDALPAEAPAAQVPPASFGEALASIQKPAEPLKAPAGGSSASKLAALAARRRKLDGAINNEVTAYTAKLAEVELKLPGIFTKAHARLDDEIAHLGDLDASLKDFANASGDDPL